MSRSENKRTAMDAIVERELVERANKAKRQAPLNVTDLRQAFTAVAKAVVDPERVRPIIEAVLLNRINLIGEEEQTYTGYPAQLMDELCRALAEQPSGEKVSMEPTEPRIGWFRQVLRGLVSPQADRCVFHGHDSNCVCAPRSEVIAVLDLVCSQRMTLAEQTATIERLRAMLAKEHAWAKQHCGLAGPCLVCAAIEVKWA